jgi:hypothetical protein
MGGPPPPGAAPPDAGPFFVENAGVVLAAAFFPRLFGELGLLSPRQSGAPSFAHEAARKQAIYVLRALAGEPAAVEDEDDLVLNKVLCGLPWDLPVGEGREPTPEELSACDGVLGVMLARWPAGGDISPEGLQKGFFRREGKLGRYGRRWRLRLDRRRLDSLLDRVPWNLSRVEHPWMREPLLVYW